MIEIDVEYRRGEFSLAIDFSAPASGVTAVFGASGAGKSTLLDIVAGLLRPDRGRIVIDGQVLLDTDLRIDVPAERRAIGWVAQDGLLFPHLDVSANLRFGAKRTRRDLRLQESRVIETLGLGSLLERWPTELSGGERQRVALGRALLAQPALLLLDEPLAAIDTPRKAGILALLETIKREFAIPALHVTHSLAEVLRLADHLVLIEAGRVLASDRIDALMGRAATPLLALRADAGSLLTLQIDAPTNADGTAIATLEGQPVRLGAAQLPGAALVATPGILRAYVAANEVIIATHKPEGISVRNVLQARVLQLRSRDDGSVLVEMALGKQHLLAAVTDSAARELGLVAGLEVYALVKSLSLDAPAGLRLLEAG